MIEHTTSAAAPVLAPAALPPLLGALWRLLSAHRAAVRARMWPWSMGCKSRATAARCRARRG
jgi:hypothetical protein